MANKNVTDKGAKEKGKGTSRRSLSVFPTNIATLDKTGVSQLAFKQGGMAEAVLEALRKHGVEA
ncbi:MAG TPA: hypothetical protein VKF15_08095, partial [Nitrososphaerales archaeon]|nr:hypothetical protein [Nitrososphaerales archaeon]